MKLLFLIFLVLFNVAAINATELNHEQFISITESDNLNPKALGVDQIWFTVDLNKAVFHRVNRPANVDKVTIQKIDKIMSQANDSYYFYNFSEDEIRTWLRENKKSTNKYSVLYTLLNTRALASDEKCSSIKASDPIKKSSSFFDRINYFASGEFIKKMVGCSTQDPAMENMDKSSLSPSDLSKILKEHWSSLKSIIAEIPKMNLPKDVKSQLACDALSVGIFVSQGLVLGGLTGVGATLVLPRLIAAFSRLLNSAKYLRASKYAAPAYQVYNESTKLNDIYESQRKMLKGLKDGARQLLDKGRIAGKNYSDEHLYELKLTIETELKLRQDYIGTLRKAQSKNVNLPINNKMLADDIAYSEKRIQKLQSLISNKGALSKIESEKNPIKNFTTHNNDDQLDLSEFFKD